MTEHDEPLEVYKRATSATLRALAENEELDVTFGKGAAGVRGNNIHVPLPNLGCSEEELNALRGVGDEFALKLRYHDETVHRRNVPRAGPAQEMFEWVEDARVASIGSLRMEGVAKNLEASLEAVCKQAAFDTVTAETEAPLSVAVGLIVRQRLTGRELPPSAENVVRFWRDFVEERAGEHIEALSDFVQDQKEFARGCRSILQDLGFGADLDDQPEYNDSDQEVESMEDAADPEAEY
ncbi:MAG: cobaltochelatase subunit CobT, partial [Gammaproteobacteria bacterium]|nr:cobaltochelatase subunit CobT [Gammaproteobacteria bacterium]